MSSIITVVCLGVILLTIIWGLFSAEDSRQERMRSRDREYMREVHRIASNDVWDPDTRRVIAREDESKEN